ncbi:MAG: PEP-CTERM sorting domain-containing protein [Phycisphaerae bacterium]|nr:PEP-CTERM sorting domain-containing protein [Phycisphaerae bacterium]
MRKLCLLLMAVLCVSGVRAATYDLNADLDFSTNPDGVWSYGYTEGGSYHLYDTVVWNVSGSTGLHVWCKDSKPDPHGNVLKNTTGSDVEQSGWPNGMYWYAGKTHMMTAEGGAAGGRSTAVRFTAPATGLYDIDIDLVKATTGDVAVDILVSLNGTTTLLSRRISNADVDAAYDALSYSLTRDDTIDILTIPVAGSGSHDGGFVITQVDAVITEVPEPATMILLAAGGLALLRRRRA